MDASAVRVRKPASRFKIYETIVLLEQVKHHNPYASDSPTAAWKAIVKALNDAKLFDSDLDERAIKDRLGTVLAWFQANDIKDRIRTGTEMEYTRLDQLLTEVSELIKSADEVRQGKKRAKTEAEENHARIGKIMKAAGESGRKADDVEKEHLNSLKGHLEAEKRDWMAETGGDEVDWEAQLRKRKEAEDKEKRDVSPHKPSTSKKSPKKTSPTKGSKLRTSRSALAKHQGPDTEIMWLEYMRESDQKRFELDKKKIDDEKEIALGEQANERLRLEIRKRELDMKQNNPYGL